jgi:hypothetical protein
MTGNQAFNVQGYKKSTGEYVVIIDGKEFVLASETPDSISDPVLVYIVKGSLSSEYGLFSAGESFVAERVRAAEFAAANNNVERWDGQSSGIEIEVSEIPVP